MIESRKQMDKFLERYQPILERCRRFTVVMELPSKRTPALLVQKRFTIRKKGQHLVGTFAAQPGKKFKAFCIEDLLDQMGCVSLVEK